MEQIITSSVEYPFGVNTERIAENLTELAKNAGVTLTGGGDFVINNHTVKGASITGADVSFANDTAKISISGSDNNFTDAYKTKLEGIATGAQVNVIENIAVNGVNASINNKTANISISSGMENFTVNGAAVTSMSVTGAASVTTANNTAQISIAGADKFTLNGATVNSASITGANVSIDATTGIADVVINSSVAAGVENVSVIGGEINASINNRTLYLYAPAKPTLADPQFTVPESLTAVAYTEVPVTISRNGDGYISPIAQPSMTWKRKNATEFTLKVNNPGDYLAGMTLTETANYYAAAKNIPVHVTQNEALKILLHFDDKNDLWKNSAPSPAAFTAYRGNYNANGKFGGYVSGLDIKNLPTSNQSVSFTVDFQCKPSSAVFYLTFNAVETCNAHSDYNRFRYQATGQSYSEYGAVDMTEIFANNEWLHYAFCYDATTEMRGVRRTGSNSVDIADTRHNSIKQFSAKSNSVRINKQVVQRSCSH